MKRIQNEFLPLAVVMSLLFSVSCKHTEIKTEVTGREDFHLPIIVQPPTKDTMVFYRSNSLNGCWYPFFGKYKFTDTLHLKGYYEWDTNYRKDFISDYFPGDEGDSLSSDGFQVFTDYETTVYQKYQNVSPGAYYFPVYLVNETQRTKVFIGKDRYVFGLQEALDASPYSGWHPIESRGYDFCGNGHFGLKVHPGEFVLFLVPKYKGGKKGSMRVRIPVGESLYISKPYIGTFNQSQFVLKKDNWVYDKLKEDKTSTILWFFYGAYPKGTTIFEERSK